jgi:hypothetical protein
MMLTGRRRMMMIMMMMIISSEKTEMQFTRLAVSSTDLLRLKLH